MSKSLILRPNILVLSPLFILVAVAAAWVLLSGYTTVSLVVLGILTWVAFLRVRKMPKEYYLVSDFSIQIKTLKDDTTVSLVNITHVESRPHWQLPFTGYGYIIIHANGQKHWMRGIKDAASTADIIRQAVEAAITREMRKSSPKRFTPPQHAPGTLEQMNDLVGLWQQGILTDEEYKKEMDRIR